MPDSKSRGTQLNFEQLGEQTQIPREFIAAMDLKETVQPCPNDVGPDKLSDTVIFSRIETNRTNERVKHTWFKKPGNITLRDVTTNQNGQPVQITRLLFPTTTTPGIPTSTSKVAVKDLGNGWSIQDSSVEGFYDGGGNFVPTIFIGPRFEKRIPDTVPDEFKVAVPVVTSEVNVEGTAAVPILLTGDLDRWEQQVDAYIKRTHVESRATIAVPITLVGKDTNDRKQIVTVTKIYKTAGGPPADTVPSALVDTSIQNLGDGRVIETIRSITFVFIEPRFEYRIPDTVPEEFKVAVPVLTTEVNVAGQAVAPIPVSGDLYKWEQQVDAFIKRTHTESRASIAVPVILVGKDTNDKKQIVTVTKIYKNISGPPANTPLSELEDTSIQNLGDGRVIETIRSIAFFYVGRRFEHRIPDTVPDEFKVAVPVLTTELNVTGLATPPIPISGDLYKWEEQVNAFIKRIHSESRASIAVPVTLVGKDTNDRKQIVTVTKIYKDETGLPANTVPSALKDTSIQNLGDGRVIETIRSILAVDPHPTFSREVPDITPPEFKALIPLDSSSVVSAGTAVPPTLVTGELKKTLTQLDLFTKRTDILERSATVGTLQDKEFGGVSDGRGSKFTGIVTTTKTLAAGLQTPDQSLFAFESEVVNLGTGQSIKATKSLASFPTLIDYVTDERGIQTTRTKKIVATGTANPEGFVSTYALDSERSLQVTEALLLTDVVTATYQIFDGEIDVQLPPQLLGLTIIPTAESGAGSYSQIASSYNLGNNGSGGIALRGSARASSAVILDLSASIKQPWGQNVPCTHYIFPITRLNSNLVSGFHISLWNFFFGPTGTILQRPVLLAWPKFAPKEVIITLVGGKATAELRGDIHATDVVRTDYLGAVVSAGSSRISGLGLLSDLELVQKTVRIPPTIHSALNIPVPILNQTTTTGGAMSVPTCTPVLMNVAKAEVNAVFEPHSVPATLGQATIPTSGTYLYKFFVEYYKTDLMLLHYVVVDFVDIL